MIFQHSSKMLALQVLVLLSIYNISAAPIYEKSLDGGTIFNIPKSYELAINFAPRITLRILTRILNMIAANQQAETEVADDSIVEFKQKNFSDETNDSLLIEHNKIDDEFEDDEN